MTSGTEREFDAVFAGCEQVEQTHISRVYLGARDAWKIKRPVDLGFLDFTTLERRYEACRAEVELNRRLAPSVYLGIEPIVRRDDSLCLGGPVPADGQVIEWVVHMRRLPRACRADLRLARGSLSRRELERIAERISAFHEAARCDATTAAYGTAEAVRRNVVENFEQTEGLLAEYLDEGQIEEIRQRQLGFLATRWLLFEQRARTGRVRDGHGDLRLEHIYLADGASEGVPEPDGIAIVDCIEFNERFRFADVCADVAFLAMDLASRRRVDLAESFLGAYARESQDYDLYAVADFYESYRAFVRGKVACLTLAGLGSEGAEAERLRRAARRYLRLALAAERRPLLEPRLVAVGGPIASGKSTLAEEISAGLGGPVIDSDRTRKFLTGHRPTDRIRVPPFVAEYAEETSRLVYRELRRRARVVLESGRPAIVEASFRSMTERDHTARLARRLGVPFLFVECRAPRDVLVERLQRRAASGGVSDGRLEILDRFLESYQPVTELADDLVLRLDTTRPVHESSAQVFARLPRWPPGDVA